MSVALSAVVLVVIFARIPTRWIEPVAVAFVVRAVVALLHFQFSFLPDSQSDALRFERTAWLWAVDGKCFNDFTTGSMLYSWLGSCIYITFGRSALLLQVINAVLGTLSVVVAMRTVRLLAPDLAQVLRIGWLVALHPSLVLYSALTMREASIVLAFGISLYCLVRWRTNMHYRYLPLSVGAALVSQLFHTGMVTASVFIVGIGVFYVVTEHVANLAAIRFSRSNLVVCAVSVVLLSALVGAVVWALGVGFGFDKFQRLMGGEVLTAISSWQAEVARGRASYLSGLYPESWIEFLWQVPIRLVYFLGAPFVWQVDNLSDLWGLVDGSAFLYVAWMLGRNYFKGGHKKPLYRLLLLLAIVVVVGFSVSTSNYGTAFRHRAKFAPLLLVLLIYGDYLIVRLRTLRVVRE